MKKHKFVEATLDDVKELNEFEKACFPHKADHFPVRNLRHLITSPTSKTLLLKNDKREIIAEVIGLLRNFKVPSGRVYKIGVHPSLQKQGVGSALIKAIEAWFIKEGMKKTCAEIRKSNKASRAMFERNGYEFLKEIPGYYVGGETATKYWKSL
jgi:ribosomal protein S18 acetylase RimI-like enzyme